MPGSLLTISVATEPGNKPEIIDYDAQQTMNSNLKNMEAAFLKKDNFKTKLDMKP